MSIPKSSNKAHIIAMLTESHRGYEAAKQARLTAITNARSVGVTFAEIGAIIGMTEDGARKMVKRADTQEANNV